jgi:hypothetical protein
VLRASAGLNFPMGLVREWLKYSSLKYFLKEAPGLLKVTFNIDDFKFRGEYGKLDTKLKIMG